MNIGPENALAGISSGSSTVTPDRTLFGSTVARVFRKTKLFISLLLFAPITSNAQAQAPSPPALIPPLGHSLGVHTFSVTQDGRLLSSWGNDGFIRIWDFQKGVFLRQIPKVSPEAVDLAFSPDGKLLARVTDGHLQVWNTQSGAMAAETGDGRNAGMPAFQRKSRRSAVFLPCIFVQR